LQCPTAAISVAAKNSHCVASTKQWRSFGLKSGVPIQKENEAPFGLAAKGKKNGEKISPAGAGRSRELS